jgi:preprotein translocase subunit SecG
MLYHFLMTVHVAACLLLILIILLQTGRGAGLAVFGGGTDSLINTPTGSSFMRKATGILAGTFAATSLVLTLLSSRAEMGSVTNRFPAPAPVAPSAPPPQATPSAPTPPAPASHK